MSTRRSSIADTDLVRLLKITPPTRLELEPQQSMSAKARSVKRRELAIDVNRG